MNPVDGDMNPGSLIVFAPGSLPNYTRLYEFDGPDIPEHTILPANTRMLVVARANAPALNFLLVVVCGQSLVGWIDYCTCCYERLT